MSKFSKILLILLEKWIQFLKSLFEPILILTTLLGSAVCPLVKCKKFKSHSIEHK